jgi:hypothetical protein
MKIFSLQSKTNLISWSLVLGLGLMFLSDSISVASHAMTGIHIPEEPSYFTRGFPLSYQYSQIPYVFAPPDGFVYPPWRASYMFLNFAFYSLFFIMILCLFRHFRKINNQMPLKVE